jgi:hypothetical protein
MVGWSRRENRGGRRRMRRPVGCLIWIIGLILLLLVLAALFGGFQKGNRVSGAPVSPRPDGLTAVALRAPAS